MDGLAYVMAYDVDGKNTWYVDLGMEDRPWIRTSCREHEEESRYAVERRPEFDPPKVVFVWSSTVYTCKVHGEESEPSRRKPLGNVAAWWKDMEKRHVVPSVALCPKSGGSLKEWAEAPNSWARFGELGTSVDNCSCPLVHYTNKKNRASPRSDGIAFPEEPVVCSEISWRSVGKRVFLVWDAGRNCSFVFGRMVGKGAPIWKEVEFIARVRTQKKKSRLFLVWCFGVIIVFRLLVWFRVGRTRRKLPFFVALERS